MGRRKRRCSVGVREEKKTLRRDVECFPHCVIREKTMCRMFGCQGGCRSLRFRAEDELGDLLKTAAAVFDEPSEPAAGSGSADVQSAACSCVFVE